MNPDPSCSIDRRWDYPVQRLECYGASSEPEVTAEAWQQKPNWKLDKCLDSKSNLGEKGFFSVQKE